MDAGVRGLSSTAADGRCTPVPSPPTTAGDGIRAAASTADAVLGAHLGERDRSRGERREELTMSGDPKAVGDAGLPRGLTARGGCWGWGNAVAPKANSALYSPRGRVLPGDGKVSGTMLDIRSAGPLEVLFTSPGTGSCATVCHSSVQAGSLWLLRQVSPDLRILGQSCDILHFFPAQPLLGVVEPEAEPLAVGMVG